MKYIRSYIIRPICQIPMFHQLCGILGRFPNCKWVGEPD